MKLINKHGFALFWLLATIDIAFIILDVEQYRIFSKPLLMPVLLATIISKVGFLKHQVSKILLVAALLLATAGDVLLLNNGAGFFIAGLVAFILMQVVYTIYFLRVKPFRSRNSVSIFSSFLLIAFIGASFCYALWNRLGDFRIPLIIYTFFLALMFTTAVNVYHYRLSKSLALDGFIPGAVLFVLSDFILASNMFYFKEAFIGIAVMATYCGAQYYLARGFIKHLR